MKVGRYENKYGEYRYDECRYDKNRYNEIKYDEGRYDEGTYDEIEPKIISFLRKTNHELNEYCPS